VDRGIREAIERATQQARQVLVEDYAAQLEGIFDVMPGGEVKPEGGLHLAPQQRAQRRKMVAAMEHKRAAGMSDAEAVADFIRDAAFTTLNRFVALKVMEARGLVQECISKGEQSAGFREFCGMAPGVALLPNGAGYRLYLECLSDELSTEIKVLFDRRDAASVLWPKRDTFQDLLALLNHPDLSSVWNEDETIGWVYQYFNSQAERKTMRGASQAPRNSRELAVRNQFFTPRYVVEFLTDNTLGRIWIEMHHGGSALAERCQYFVRRPEGAPVVRPRKDPRDLRILDPACGSGHFLLYCFDLLLLVYEEAWADPESPASEASGRTLRADYPEHGALRRAAPALIVERNLYGVDIDPRAAQIAALTLWLRAQRAFQNAGVAVADRRIHRTHIVVAEPMPGDAAMVEEFAARLHPPLLRDLFRKMEEEMRLAGELGTLVRAEEGIAGDVQRARQQFVQQRQSATLPGFEDMRYQRDLDLSGIDDDRFFQEAERRICDELHRYAAAANPRRRLFAGDAEQGVALIEILRTRFDVVLMNPPFGDSCVRAKDELGRAYPRTRNDLYAAFVERGVQLLNPQGMLGAITSRTGFFLSSFQKWREEILLKEAPPVVFADLGFGVLDTAMVEVAAYCLEKGCEVAA
jgi:23S rRNA G2445 N2-methylase RlmL